MSENDKGVRLNRYLALCGVASRRKSEAIIQSGRVKVNGTVVRDLATTVNPDVDSVTFDGNVVRPVDRFSYILLNKPSGVITSASDDRNRKTVLDLIKIKSRIFPVGRLDYDTEGVLLLTDDGDLAYALTHPSREIDKTYIATLNRPFEREELKKLTSGLMLDDGMTSPCEAWILGAPRAGTRVKLTIHEGRKRQVKRMFQALGYHTRRLQRESFAGLTVEDLRPGQWRRLNAGEVSRLRQLTKLKRQKFQ